MIFWAMVSLGLFGLAKLVAQGFSGDPTVMGLVRGLMPWLGLAPPSSLG